MAAAYRVAAPSIRFVPWAALASCWPLLQQLLPVSATGGGRRCCTLRIFSGKIILNFGFLKSLRTFQKPFFHGWGRKGKRQLPRLLPAEAAARRARSCWLNSLSQNLTVLPTPSEREPLACPEGFSLHRMFSNGANGVRPLRHRLRRCHLSQRERQEHARKLARCTQYFSNEP